MYIYPTLYEIIVCLTPVPARQVHLYILKVGVLQVFAQHFCSTALVCVCVCIRSTICTAYRGSPNSHSYKI